MRWTIFDLTHLRCVLGDTGEQGEFCLEPMSWEWFSRHWELVERLMAMVEMHFFIREVQRQRLFHPGGQARFRDTVRQTLKQKEIG